MERLKKRFKKRTAILERMHSEKGVGDEDSLAAAYCLRHNVPRAANNHGVL
jgi:predicted nucleic acid-binding protein